jgi:hypothetical protein
MRNSKGKSLKEILEKLKPEQKETVGKLRFLTKTALPDVVETVKWGISLTFWAKTILLGY